MSKNPIPTVEFHITEKCNYRCEYCFQGKGADNYKPSFGHATDEVIDAFINFLSNLDESYEVNIIGGEPLVHPRFFEVVEKTVSLNHKVSFGTNFSYPVEFFQRLVDVSGKNLSFLAASLHLSQVKDLNEFVEKAVEFNTYKHSESDFMVLSVLTEENYPIIKQLYDRFTGLGVKFNPQNLKVDGQYVNYSPEVEAFIEPLRTNLLIDVIKDRDVRGIDCHTGYKFFNIYWDGRVNRCYNNQGEYTCLGNILNGSFKAFDRPMPCMSDRCTCVFPVLRNMLVLGDVKCR